MIVKAVSLAQTLPKPKQRPVSHTGPAHILDPYCL